MALRGRRINNFIRLWCLVASGGLHICVLSTSFQKNDIGWPQQPLQEEYQISVKNWIFDDPFHKKGLVLVIWVLGMIKSSGSVIFLMKWGCWGHWGHWGCWGRWGHWGCRSFKAWKTTTEDFRVIKAFEFSFIFMFWKKNVLRRIMKYHIEFLHLFCQRLLRPAHVIFLKTGWWNTNVQSSWSH